MSFASPADLSPLPAAEVRYLTERVRGVAQGRASDALMLMTRANLLALLPPGVDLADCEGECEVETGRSIGADYPDPWLLASCTPPPPKNVNGDWVGISTSSRSPQRGQR